MVATCLHKRRQNNKGRPVRGRTLAGDETSGDVAMVQLTTHTQPDADTGSQGAPDSITLPSPKATSAAAGTGSSTVQLHQYSEAGAPSGLLDTSNSERNLLQPQPDSAMLQEDSEPTTGSPAPPSGDAEPMADGPGDAEPPQAYDPAQDPAQGPSPDAGSADVPDTK